MNVFILYMDFYLNLTNSNISKLNWFIMVADWYKLAESELITLESREWRVNIPPEPTCECWNSRQQHRATPVLTCAGVEGGIGNFAAENRSPNWEDVFGVLRDQSEAWCMLNTQFSFPFVCINASCTYLFSTLFHFLLNIALLTALALNM